MYKEKKFDKGKEDAAKNQQKNEEIVSHLRYILEHSNVSFRALEFFIHS
jgi:hypothetical protein